MEKILNSKLSLSSEDVNEKKCKSTGKFTYPAKHS